MNNSFIEAQAALRDAIKASVLAFVVFVVAFGLAVTVPFDLPDGPFLVLLGVIIMMVAMFNAIYRLHVAVVINETK